jgi:hypothetical protein
MPDLIVLPRLPYRTRARLRFTRWIDLAAARLIDHGHHQAAMRLWRACRLL